MTRYAQQSASVLLVLTARIKLSSRVKAPLCKPGLNRRVRTYHSPLTFAGVRNVAPSSIPFSSQLDSDSVSATGLPLRSDTGLDRVSNSDAGSARFSLDPDGVYFGASGDASGVKAASSANSSSSVAASSAGSGAGLGGGGSGGSAEPSYSIQGEALPGRAAYLDLQATTPLDPRVLDAMLPYYVQRYGNPHSRTHAYGWEAESAVEKARAQGACSVVTEVFYRLPSHTSVRHCAFS